MCSSHAPEAGADSIVERPFRVLIDTHDGGRASFVVKAIGPKGAYQTAWQTAIDLGYDPMAVAEVEERAA